MQDLEIMHHIWVIINGIVGREKLLKRALLQAYGLDFIGIQHEGCRTSLNSLLTEFVMVRQCFIRTWGLNWNVKNW